MRLTDRRVIRLRGAESVPFLDNLVTQTITPDAPCYAALLTPQGRVVAELFSVPQPEDGSLLLDVPDSQAEALCAALTRYRLRRLVEILPTYLQVVVSEAEIPGGYRDPRLAELGWRSFSRGDTPDSAHDEMINAMIRRYHALGVPPFVPAEAFPLEYNLDFLNGVSFTKGCYVGQEVTARMHHRRLVRKRLFPVDGDDPPCAFALVRLDAAPDPALRIRRPAWMTV